MYPSSSDEEKNLTSESSKVRIPSSPVKIKENDQGTENESGRQLIDGNLSEGTPPSSDPWKMLSEIKGKITKTFEEKFSEMKNDKKKRRANKDNSSISDSEDPGDITPTDENIKEKQEKDSGVCHKSNATRFVGFSEVKTGLKTKNSQDDNVESGVEAAEFSENIPETPSLESWQSNSHTKNKENYMYYCHLFNQLDGYIPIKQEMKFNTLLSCMKNNIFQQLTKQLAVLFLILSFHYLIPLPAYLIGFSIGVFTTVMVYKLIQKIKEILATPLKNEVQHTVPVLEIPAAEEHAVQERYEGWLNELQYTYNPNDYHVARTKSVFFSLEGGMLRIMETEMRVPKRAVWDEPKRRYKFTKKRIYNLTGAKIELLPDGLIRRRYVYMCVRVYACILFILQMVALILLWITYGTRNAQSIKKKIIG